jgi:PAS domain S-box-containing protein
MQTNSLIEQRSSADLHRLLETLPAAAYTCDRDGMITYFNQRAVELWGRAPKVNDPEDRFCGSFRLFASDGTPIRHDRCWMALALQENKEFNGHEIIIERPDGTRVTALAHANPLRDDRGNLDGAVNVLVDISDRKAAEEARAYLAAIVASSHDAIISKTMDGIVTSWNLGAERLYGYMAEEVIGQPISLLLPPDRPDEFPAIMARIRRGERVEPYETVRVTKNGERVDVWLTVSPVHTADGRVIGASAIAKDVTERKRLEDGQRLLAAAGATLGASLQNAANLEHVAQLALPTLGDQCVVLLRQEDGTLESIAAALYGPANDESIEDQVPHPLVERKSAAIQRVISTGRSELYPTTEPEQMNGRRDASRQRVRELGDVSGMVVPLPARGKILGAMIFASQSGRHYTARDLTLAEELGRRCALAVDNGRLYEQAQSALRLRNEVMGTVTHDLKNPLAGISALAQVLELQLRRGREPSAEQLTAGLRSIHERVRDMARQLDELLDVAALEAGQPLELRRKPTDIVLLAGRVASDAQGTSDRHDIQVVSDSEEITGEWDPLRLERVLRNLLNNAVKYSPEGGRITIRVSCHEDALQRWVKLVVQDEGVGIPANDLPRIFERFRRGGNVAGRINGTGLGLAAVRQIVEEHEGTIAIESQEGAGTVVTVILPAFPVKAATTAA